MKKHPPSYDKTIRDAVIRRSDLRFIAEVVGARNGASIKVSSDEGSFENIDELLAYRDPLKTLRIRRDDWSFDVTLNGESVTISCDRADDFDLGAASRLHALFLKRRSWLRRARFFVVAGAAMLLPNYVSKALDPHSAASFTFTIVSGFTFLSLYLVYDYKREKMITFRRRGRS